MESNTNFNVEYDTEPYLQIFNFMCGLYIFRNATYL